MATFSRGISIHIKGADNIDTVSARDKDLVSADVGSFLQRYKTKFSEGNLHIYFKQGKKTLKNEPRVNCSITLVTTKGKFNGTNRGWGILNATHKTLENLDTQLQKRFTKIQPHVSVRRVVTA